MAHWRRMRPDDLAAVDALMSAFHVQHPERSDIAPERLALAGEWCFVLEGDEGGFAGYCVSHPWAGVLPPGLDVLIGALPDRSDHLHIHDVVLIEAMRGQGLAGTLMAMLEAQARKAGFLGISLIAVGAALAYWRRQGFSEDHNSASIEFVAGSYGADATPMLRPLEPIATALSD